jgi:hypothetical protein
MYDRSYQSRSLKPQFILTGYYAEKGLKKEAYTGINNIFKQISNKGVSNEYIVNRLEAEEIKAQLAFSENRQAEAVKNLSDKNNYLVYHFLMKLAYGLHDIYTNSKIFNSLNSDPFLFSFLDIIDFTKFSAKIVSVNFNDPLQNAIKIYVAAILNYLNPESEEYYMMLKKLLPEVIPFFDQSEMYNIYQMAEAICWMKMETIDRKRYRRELFELNRMRLAHGIYSPDGKEIRILLFRQVLMNALHLKEIEWAEEFVKEYSVKLPAEIKIIMRNFSEAHISFEKKEFIKSLDQLKRIDFALFTLKFDYRNLLLRIYIELNYIEEALSLIDSYRHFTGKNKNVSDYYKSITQNFLQYCKHIIDLKNGKSKPDRYAIEALLEKDNAVNYKTWLQEKLSEI